MRAFPDSFQAGIAGTGGIPPLQPPRQSENTGRSFPSPWEQDKLAGSTRRCRSLRCKTFHQSVDRVRAARANIPSSREP